MTIPIEHSTDQMREVVSREIEEHWASRKAARAELKGIIDCRKLVTYLNNFLFNLPSSLGRTQNEVELTRAKRSRAKDRGRYISLYRELVDEESSTPYYGMCNLTIESIVAKGHSERFARNTTTTLKHDVALAIKSAGFDEKQVMEPVDKFYAAKRIDEDVYRTLFLPIFIELRRLGYAVKDLTL